MFFIIFAFNDSFQLLLALFLLINFLLCLALTEKREAIARAFKECNFHVVFNSEEYQSKEEGRVITGNILEQFLLQYTEK